MPGWTFFFVHDISETWIKPLDPRLQLDERAVVGDVGDAAVEARLDRIFRLDALPRVVEQLLHAERDAVRLVVDLDDLHLDGLADVQHPPSGG